MDFCYRHISDPIKKMQGRAVDKAIKLEIMSSMSRSAKALV